MGIYQSLAGSVRIELTSADVAGSLQAINAAEIPVSNLCTVGDLTVEFTILHRYLNKIQNMSDQKGDRVIVLSHNGVFWLFRRMTQRPVILFCLCMLFLCAILLPTRVLFVEVEGNERIPDNMVLEAAKNAGIGFGVSRRVVRSEKMKNQLLDEIPQLQWAGVNTHGCTAIISVRERADGNRNQKNYTVSNIVASTDGIITSCTITGGAALCQEGQVVKKGQILISGYSDCGSFVTAGRSQGEVFAKTRHELTAVSPAHAGVRMQIAGKKTYYSLCFGKKRINFYKGSGISDGSCVKMIRQYHLTLPGNYTLPLVLVKEEQIDYQVVTNQIDTVASESRLSDFLESLIQNQGIALCVIDAQETFENKNGLIILKGVYNCTEMIGREQGVQIGDSHGKTD